MGCTNPVDVGSGRVVDVHITLRLAWRGQLYWLCPTSLLALPRGSGRIMGEFFFGFLQSRVSFMCLWLFGVFFVCGWLARMTFTQHWTSL
jgi:hypothetical protein